MGSSGVPCPWEHSVLFCSEDNKPKALTNGDGWSRSCRGMAAIIWILGIGCITPVCYSILIGLNGCSNQSPSICTHRQGKGTSFFAALQLLQTKSNSWGGTKDESPPSGIFWTWHGWCWLVDWMEKGLPILCYTWLKPWWSKTLGCLLCLNWFCNLSFSPQRAHFMYC